MGRGLIQGRGCVGTDTREGWVKWVYHRTHLSLLKVKMLISLSSPS